MKRHFIRVLAVIALLVFIVVIGVFTVANTDWGRGKVRDKIVGIIQDNSHGIVKVGSVSGNLLKGFTLHDLVITDSSGAPFVKIEEASARYALTALYGQKIEFDAVRLVRPVIVLDRQVADQRSRNAALYKTGTEVLSRYEKFGLGKSS